MINRIRRWLKFLLSRKTRNRSRAQKAAWVRRKIEAGARDIGITELVPAASHVKSVSHHDFRDYPTCDRPDHDLDTRGNPLRPGT